MGYTFDLPLPGSGSAPRRLTPPRAAPVRFNNPADSLPSASNFLKADLSGPLVTGIGLAAATPGYVMDRPIALANTLTGGDGKGNKGFIDQAGDTIRNIPLAGPLLSGVAQGVGNTYEGLQRLTHAPINAGMMNALVATRGLAPDAKVDGLTAWLSGAGGLLGDLTVAELRRVAAERGFTDQEVQDTALGKRSMFDWSEKRLSNNAVVDIAGNIAADPTTLIAFGGVARAAKVGADVVGGLTFGRASALGAKVDRIAAVANDINRAVIVSRKPYGTVEGMMALRAGDVTNVSLGTFARHMAMVSRGSSDFLRAYRRVAFGTWVTQLAAQELSKHDVGENTPLSPLFESVYEVANRMAEQKPLSSGMLFNVWSAVNFPVHDMLSETWASRNMREVGGKMVAGGLKFGPIQTGLLKRYTDVERKVVESLAPGKTFAEGRKYLIGRFGSEQRYMDHIYHFTRSATAERFVAPALMNQPIVTTAQFAAMAEKNNQILADVARAQLANGKLTSREIVDSIKAAYTGERSHRVMEEGNVAPEAGAVHREWDPEKHIDNFNEWADRMTTLSLAAGFNKGMNVVVGVMDGVMPKEHLEMAKATLKAIANDDGTIPKSAMDRFLELFPALQTRDLDPGSFFSRLRAVDSREVKVGEAIQRIDKLLKDPSIPTMREYLWNVEQWEKRAENLRRKRGTIFNEQGTPDANLAPDIGQAGVLAPSLKSAVRRRLGLGGDTYADVLAARGRADVRAREDDVAFGMDEAGWNVRSATQGVTSKDGQMSPAVAVHLDSATDPGSMELAAAILAKQLRSERATYWYSGPEALAKNGLEANATHVRYDVGNMPDAEKEAVLRHATDMFDGQYELNDAAGVLHVFAKPEQDIEALSDAILGVAGDRVHITEAPAHVGVVKNDLKGRGRGRLEPGERSARSILADSADDQRLINTNTWTQRATRLAQSRTAFSKSAVDARGTVGANTADGTITRGPEYARVERGDLGGDGRGVDPVIEAHDASGTQGQVLFLAEKDDALEALTPRLTGRDVNPDGLSDLGGLDPAQLEKIKALETELRQYDPQYRLKMAPTRVGKTVGTYYPGQGDTIKDIMAASQAAGDLMQHAALKPAARFWRLLTDPVQTKVLSRDAKQALYREMLAKTAHLPDDKTIRIKDIDSFLQTAAAAARESRLFKFPIAARWDLISPETMRRIATGDYAQSITRGKGGGVFEGFTEEALAALGGPDAIHAIIDRAGSKFYRDLENSTRGRGGLGKAIQQTYHGVREKTNTPRHYLRTYYHLFRFALDPRYHIMNHGEADILGLMRSGWGSTRFGGARNADAIDSAYMAQRGPVQGVRDPAKLGDMMASGYLDGRHIEGYVGRTFREDRASSARDALRTMAQEDPAIQILRREFGGTEDEWVAGLDKMMYDIDTKGARAAIDDEVEIAVAENILSEAEREAMRPLFTKLYQRNEQSFKDAVSTFHGNFDRSTLERVMNSYFLWWPLSYQIKAARNLFRALTYKSLGRKTNLGGAWYIDTLYQEHVRKLAEDEDYQRMFVDNPALWQTAAMLLPITPYDMGVSFSRASRYMLAAVGVRDANDKYFAEDPVGSAIRLAMIGPVYSYELAQRLRREWSDNPRPLEVAVNNN